MQAFRLCSTDSRSVMTTIFELLLFGKEAKHPGTSPSSITASGWRALLNKGRKGGKDNGKDANCVIFRAQFMFRYLW